MRQTGGLRDGEPRWEGVGEKESEGDKDWWATDSKEKTKKELMTERDVAVSEKLWKRLVFTLRPCKRDILNIWCPLFSRDRKI